MLGRIVGERVEQQGMLIEQVAAARLGGSHGGPGPAIASCSSWLDGRHQTRCRTQAVPGPAGGDDHRQQTVHAAPVEVGRVTYAIEYYQREYAWCADEVATPLTDLLSEFERTVGVRQCRWAAAEQYFLAFVYADQAGIAVSSSG